MDPQVGQLINNKYRLVRLIGDGGMGSVFEARHELLGTTVALKFLHPALTRRKGLVERFLQEAQVSARIDNSHVVRVSDVDRTYEGLAFMVMEYVVGETLQMLYERNYQQGTRLAYGDAFDYMQQLLDGVGSAHKLGIVHRDLKLDNVMLSHGGDGKTLVKILDFGIAKLKASGEVDRGLTRPGVVMGTPEYMAPEQAFSADKVDARADIFSLGVMFFEMLAGRRPVGGDNAHAIAAQYLEGSIAQLGELAPSLDPELAAAVHRSMAAKPEDRFETMAQFRDVVAEFAPEGPQRVAQSNVGLADTQDDGSVGDVAAAAVAGAVAAAAATPGVPKTLPPADGPPADGMAADGQAGEGQAADDETDGGGGDTTADRGASPGASDGAAEQAPPMTPASAADDDGPTVDDSALGPSVVGDPAAPMPLRAGTEKMPDDALVGVGRGGTEAIAAQPDGVTPDGAAPEAAAGAGRAGGTVVGDPFGGPDMGPEQAVPVPLDGGYGQAPAMTPHSPVGTTPATAPVARNRPKKSGPSFLSILLLAGVVSGAVVGGVYVAHRASQAEDADDPDPVTTQADPPPTPPADPPPTVNPPPIQPPTVEPPPPTTPPATTTKPPTKPPTKPTAKPTAKPSAQPPWILPSSLPPPMIPSGLPPLFKLPGNNGPPLPLPPITPPPPKPTATPPPPKPTAVPPKPKATTKLPPLKPRPKLKPKTKTTKKPRLKWKKK